MISHSAKLVTPRTLPSRTSLITGACAVRRERFRLPLLNRLNLDHPVNFRIPSFIFDEGVASKIEYS